MQWTAHATKAKPVIPTLVIIGTDLGTEMSLTGVMSLMNVTTTAVTTTTRGMVETLAGETATLEGKRIGPNSNFLIFFSATSQMLMTLLFGFTQLYFPMGMYTPGHYKLFKLGKTFIARRYS